MLAGGHKVTVKQLPHYDTNTSQYLVGPIEYVSMQSFPTKSQSINPFVDSFTSRRWETPTTTTDSPPEVVEYKPYKRKF